MTVIEERQIPNLFTILPLPLPQPLSSIISAGLPNITPSASVHSTTSVTPSLTQASSAASGVGTPESISVTTSSSLSTSESPSITPTPTPSDLPLQATTSADGSTYYLTLYTTPSPSPSVQAPPSNSKGFLQNKALAGTVLAVVGVAGLAILIAIATIAFKRSRHQRLHAEAVSFDPSSTMEEGTTGKRRFSLLSSDHGHDVSNNFVGGNPGLNYAATNPTSAHGGPYQDPYRFAVSESQHALNGNMQPSWSGVDSTPHVPQIDPGLVRGYGGGPNLPRYP